MKYLIHKIPLLALLLTVGNTMYGQISDTSETKNTKDTSLIWDIEDSEFIDFRNNYHSMDLDNPSNYNMDVEYDPETNSYYFIQKIGDQEYRMPSSMSMEEYFEYKTKKDEQAYWQKRAKTLSLFSEDVVLPKMYKDESLFDRIFGGTDIQVRPQGNVDISLGYKRNVTKNPLLPTRQQSVGIPDFDVQMNIGLIAKIGDKIKFNFNYNTKATFDFNNQLRLNYTGKDDEIIKNIELGYTSLNLPTKLIQGTQTLFGIKTELQFGRLRLTNVVSQQRSQKQSLQIQGGAQRQDFEVSAMDYDENRHFLLTQYFRDHYNSTLVDFPIIRSQININRIEVWITNKNATTIDTREVLAFMDLGEANPYQTQYAIPGNDLPDNGANALYSEVLRRSEIRETNRAIPTLSSMGLSENKDFNKVLARKLTANEYTIDPQLGYISLTQTLQPDQVLAVAFQYTYNGQVYQVGEFSQEITPDSSNQKLLFLKMLKSTQLNTRIPLWDLMMKNVYNIGGFGIDKENFALNVMYQKPGQSMLRYLPEGPEEGKALIQVLNLDRLNNQGDPQPDGLFDFIPDRTILPKSGRIIFPVLEPFGEDLYPALGNDPDLIDEYGFPTLYDSTKFIAQQYSSKNRFYLQGSYKSSSNSEIFLGGFNIPEGSVTIRAGGQTLVENIDYTIDYGIGKVNILNQNLLSSGIPLDIRFENNSTFGFLQQSLFGTRADYYVNEHLSLGATYLRLNEKPFTAKVDVGEDPINNRVFGADFNYQNESKWLTRVLDKLPVYSTKAPSNIVASGEVAKLVPGHNKLINQLDPEGSVYIDNFEGTRSSFDLKFPFSAWALASTPVDAQDRNNNILFPEAKLNDNLEYNKNRARLNWYFIDPDLVGQTSFSPDNLRNDTAELSKPYARLIKQQEVFPDKQTQAFNDALQTFDLAYYQKERGAYNFSTVDLDPNGQFVNPRDKWGGLMRSVNYNNFEASNIEYIEIWVMDPYSFANPNNTGSMYIDLGNVSEDILKDSRKSFENGMPFPKDESKVVSSNWGKSPRNQQQLTIGFNSDPDARVVQDIGIDGLSDEEEKTKFGTFVQNVQNILGGANPLSQRVAEDPSGDDFKHYRDATYDQSSAGILERYSQFNNPEGNSAVATTATSSFTQSSTNIPDAEDLNRDNTLNEAEEYFQYRIDFKPNMQIGENHIVNIQESIVELPNQATTVARWYQLKIPINAYDHKVGGINDFRSIRFMRMFLSGFEDTVIMRFAKIDLTRSQWRKYSFILDSVNSFIPVDPTPFVVGSVSLEENANAKPIPYVLPPGVDRQNLQAATGVNLQVNEQSLSLDVCNLPNGDSRSVFRELNFDIRQFRKLKMFLHAESKPDQLPIADGELEAFIRMGSDMSNNYYEYTVPLKITDPGATIASEIWPEANYIDIELDSFVAIKLRRDKSGFTTTDEYSEILANGKLIKIRGVPNFAQVKNIMLGVRNANDNNTNDACAIVWFNELRVSDMIQSGGVAATGELSVQLADLGAVNFSGTMHTAGYGNIDQRVNERYQENLQNFSVNTNLNIGRLFPSKWGVQWPLFLGTNQNISIPKYDPYDKDVLYKEKLNSARNDSIRKAYRDAARTVDIVNTLSMQGIKIVPVKDNTSVAGAKPKGKSPLSISNFDFGYNLTELKQSNPLLEKNDLTQQKLNAAYNYSYQPKYIYPLKKMMKKSKNLLFKDININLLPNSFTVNSEMYKQDGETLVRDLGNDGLIIPVTYNKFFTWTRNYGFQWDFTKSIKINYTATNLSRIDQPDGEINTQVERDSIWTNVRKGGRNTNFNQNIGASYQLPFKKIPALSFIDSRVNYSGTYTFTANSLLAEAQGNDVANTMQASANGRMNFVQLYNKSKRLRKIINPNTIPTRAKAAQNAKRSSQLSLSKEPEGKGGERSVSRSQPPPSNSETANEDLLKQIDSVKKQIAILKDSLKYDKLLPSQLDTFPKSKLKEIQRNDKKITKQIDKLDKWLNRPEIPKSKQALIRFLIMPQNLNFNYSQNRGTNLPGYMTSPDYFGMNGDTWNPGWDFVTGLSPDRSWLLNQANVGMISRDSFYVNFMSQNYSENYSANLGLMPFRNVRVDLNINQSFSRSYSSLLKDTTYTGDYFDFLSMQEMGSFSNTFVGVSTLLEKIVDGSSSIPSYFNQFLSNRIIISERLSQINPYSGLVTSPEDPGFYKGYTRYAQDVLIPSFVAAFRGQDASEIPLVLNNPGEVSQNPFRNFIPLPNWKVRINSLNKWGGLDKIFTSLSIDHAYSGTLNVNGLTSNLTFEDLYTHNYPSFIDSISGNFVPYFFVPNITITESFKPLIGINASTASGWDFSVDYKASNSESLSLVDLQLSENKTAEYSISVGKRWKDVRPVFGIKASNKWKGDLNLSIAMSYRNGKQSVFRLQDNSLQVTGGQRMFALTPNLDYIINKNFTFRFYFDTRRINPHFNAAFPTSTTRGGVTLRYTFTQ